MMTTVATRAVALNVKQALSSLLANWEELPAINQHFAIDTDSFINRFFQTKKQAVASKPWTTFYYYRTGLDVEIARLNHVLWAKDGQTYKLPFIPRARCIVNFVVLSNSAIDLEEVEESIYLRHLSLVGNLEIIGKDFFSGLGPFTTTYALPQDSNIQFRLNPTEFGSESEVTFSLEVFFPLIKIPPSLVPAKRIERIVFEIWAKNTSPPVLLGQEEILP